MNLDEFRWSLESFRRNLDETLEKIQTKNKQNSDKI